MADDGSAQSTSVWPLPKFYFKIDLEGLGNAFQEASGLNVESTPIEYRDGNNKNFAPAKMPGLKKYGNITLKKGVFVKDNKFFDWFNQIKMNTIKRQPLTVSLLDESGNPTMVWKMQNAWPTKITGTDMKSTGNEVAVETIEIAHEGLTIENK